MIRKILSLFLSFSLIITQPVFAQGVSELNIGKYLNRMPAVKPDSFRPAHLRYVSYDIKADSFQLLLDKGDSPKLQDATRELFNYFLIGLSLPNDKFWVNLRPDAPEQIIDPLLEKTDMGKIMLEADLQLKKDTAGLTSPQNPEGKEYWDKLYKKSGELFGTENITIPTITRPWIVPGEVIIRESEDSAYIYKANLKVMLEEDYLRETKPAYQQGRDEGRGTIISYGFNDPRMKELNKYSTQLIKELILPRLTQEINTSKKYAQLRQVFFSLILSRWFKDKYKGKPGQYSSLIDSRNLDKLNSKESWNKEYYFNEYKKSFRQGEYNLKEQVSTPTGQVIRSYVSGGIKPVPEKIDSFKATSPILTEIGKHKFVFAALLFASAFVGGSIHNHLSEPTGIIKNQDQFNAINSANQDFLNNLIRIAQEEQERRIEPMYENWKNAALSELDKNQRNNVIESIGRTIKTLSAIYEDDKKLINIFNKVIELLKNEKAGSSPLAPQEGVSSPVGKFKEIVGQAFALLEVIHQGERYESALKGLADIKRSFDEDDLRGERIKILFDVIDVMYKAYLAEGEEYGEEQIVNKYRDVWNYLYHAAEQGKGINAQNSIAKIKQFIPEAINSIQGKPKALQQIKQYVDFRETKEGIIVDNIKSIGDAIITLKAIFASTHDDKALELDELLLEDVWFHAIMRDIDNVSLSPQVRDADKNEVCLGVLYKDRENWLDRKVPIYGYRVTTFIASSDSSGSSALVQDLSRAIINTSVENKVGGIDFTRINYLTRPMGSFQGLDLRLPLLSKAELEGIDINKELASVEQMVSAKIDVSSDRLKRLLAAMSQKDAFNAQREAQLLPLLLRLCWLKEEKGLETTPDFRAILLIADTGLFVEQGNTKYSLN